MSELHDPRRVFDSAEAPQELRALLEAAHDDRMEADAVERVAAGSAARIGDPVGGGPGDGGASPIQGAAGGASSGKVLAGIAAAALIAGGVWIGARSSSRDGAPSIPQAPAVASAHEQAATPEEKGAPPAEATAASSSASTPPASAEVVATAKPSVAARPAGSAGRPVEAEKADGAARIEEHRLLMAARQELGRDPQRAWALTQEHARRFPKGILAQEREVIAIEALSRMGRGKDARDRAQDFREQYPGSPHRDSVDTATKSTP